ncbi:MAG TPA: DUF742 domain-containing protein [Pseudonocardia sp.]
MNGAQRPWPGEGSQYDGRVVPIFAMTGGRTRSTQRDLPIESLVTATERTCTDLEPEYRAIVGMARRPVSLVEIGAALGAPVGVARVLVGDLADSGHLVLHAPPPTFDGNPTPEILTRLLEGLRAR